MRPSFLRKSSLTAMLKPTVEKGPHRLRDTSCVPRQRIMAAWMGRGRGDGQGGLVSGYFLRSSQQDLLMDRLWGLRRAEGVAQAPGFLDPSKVTST